jgi:hypothetical protein
LIGDNFTLSIDKNSVQSFVFGFRPSIKGSAIEWKHSFLVVAYFGRGGIDTLVVPMEVGRRAVEGDKGYLLIATD